MTFMDSHDILVQVSGFNSWYIWVLLWYSCSGQWVLLLIYIVVFDEDDGCIGSSTLSKVCFGFWAFSRKLTQGLRSCHPWPPVFFCAASRFCNRIGLRLVFACTMVSFSLFGNISRRWGFQYFFGEYEEACRFSDQQVRGIAVVARCTTSSIRFRHEAVRDFQKRS